VTQNQHTKSAQTLLDDEENAISYISNEIYQKDMTAVIFFCSPQYNLDKITASINRHFECMVIGCTTAGEIGDRYETGGISAVSFSSKAFCLHPHLFNLSSNNIKDATSKIIATSALASKFKEDSVGKSSVGFLLIDGLTMKEEKTIGMIHDALPMLPIIGGSAGDNLNFEETFVFYNKKFHTNSAIFTLIETHLDFEIFQFQHFQPSEIEIVVTDVDSSKRIVKEIDGEKASQRFAELVNIPIEKLSPQTFSMNPLMLEIGKDWYVRSIQKCNPDGSLQFYSAIENGLPLTLGKGMNIAKNLETRTQQILKRFCNIELTLGCDCILRRLEITERNKKTEIEKSLKKLNFIGFNTYGEQINSIHVNQTLTGIVFGEKRSE